MPIRFARSGDRARIISILERAMSPEYMREMEDELDEVFAGRCIGFVSAVSSMPIGYITCQRTTETYKLETLAVDPEYQGRGIGRSLVQHLENYLLDTVPHTVIVLNVVTDDASEEPVMGFYEKCGFSKSGVVENEFSMGDRQVHLCKILRRE